MNRRAFVANHLLFVVCVAASFASSRSKGNDLYVSSNLPNPNGVIYKYTSSGSRSSFGSHNNPTGLAFDRDGNLFAGGVEPGISPGDRIYKYSPSGQKTVFASGLDGPMGLAFDSSGNLFEVDDYSGTINKFSPTGAKTIFATGLRIPVGLAFDDSGNLFVTNRGGASGSVGSVYKFSPDGTRSTFVSGLRQPTGLAFDRQGDLFVSVEDYIYKFTPGGVQLAQWQGTFGEPGGLAFDSTGNLFEAGPSARAIYKFDATGNRSTFATDIPIPFFIAFPPVPEPSTSILMMVALTAFSGCRHRPGTYKRRADQVVKEHGPAARL